MIHMGISTERPSPDEMLARVQAEVARERGGKLKIFFGYAAGVGKTYAMLEAAQRERSEGVDVVVGYVEPHGRVETEALLTGLELLPSLEVDYRGTKLREFDLDAALARKPQLILVDELAHTNAPGARHGKRWQDVDDLRKAGIDVWTTLNVQHIESLNDVIAQITGVVVRETVPDGVFFQADDVELVDLTPDELLVRLREGKVYVPAQAERAIAHFFQKGNLTALRELALRRTADRINVDVQFARRAVAARRTWPTAERLLVCVGPSPTSAKVIRAAKRLADRLTAEWVAVHVATPGSPASSEADRHRLLENLRLAERLGAEIVELSGVDVVDELLNYASGRNITKIVVGKTGQPIRRWFERESLVDRLVRFSADLDVYVVRGFGEPTPTRASALPWRAERRPAVWWGTGLILAVCTALALTSGALGFSEANLVMIYLMGVVITAARFGTWPSIAASILSVLLFDVLFTEPYYHITVRDSQYLVTFAVMLGVGLGASTLASRIRLQAEVSHRNERQTEALYRLSKQLIGLSDSRSLVEHAEHTVSEVFDAHAVIFLTDEQNRVRPIIGHMASFAASAPEIAAAQWVVDRSRPAGLGTDTLPGAQALYLPLATHDDVVGVLALQPRDPGTVQSLEARHLLETFATQIAFAVRQNRLSEESRQTQLEMQTERIRSSLLSSVSHDLRTPLAVIAGASSSLLASPTVSANQAERELLETICDESNRLSQLVENLLHMTRLATGTVQVRKEWHVLEDIVGSALGRLSKQLADRSIETHLPEDLPLIPVDAVLIEQVLINLLDNAIRYSPAGAPITISAAREDQRVVVEVADRGPGLRPGDEQRIFEKFYRAGEASRSQRGSGLGLAICRAIVEAHGGRIWAGNRPHGGASFSFSVPLDGEPPSIPIDDEPESA